mmetsp:Transcript_74026/g.130810  ORF Transcript_74026/g.130810 Transcript_74026/m.130810 type:complete len:232 (-) Transcript_74026:567-1262(-)
MATARVRCRLPPPQLFEQKDQALQVYHRQSCGKGFSVSGRLTDDDGTRHGDGCVGDGNADVCDGTGDGTGDSVCVEGSVEGSVACLKALSLVSQGSPQGTFSFESGECDGCAVSPFGPKIFIVLVLLDADAPDIIAYCDVPSGSIVFSVSDGCVVSVFGDCGSVASPVADSGNVSKNFVAGVDGDAPVICGSSASGDGRRPVVFGCTWIACASSSSGSFGGISAPRPICLL